MFERVYHHERTLEGAERGKIVVTALYRHYESNPETIPGWSLPDDPAWRRAADYVSGMTDHYALKARPRIVPGRLKPHHHRG